MFLVCVYKMRAELFETNRCLRRHDDWVCARLVASRPTLMSYGSSNSMMVVVAAAPQWTALLPPQRTWYWILFYYILCAMHKKNAFQSELKQCVKIKKIKESNKCSNQARRHQLPTSDFIKLLLPPHSVQLNVRFFKSGLIVRHIGNNNNNNLFKMFIANFWQPQIDWNVQNK